MKINSISNAVQQNRCSIKINPNHYNFSFRGETPADIVDLSDSLPDIKGAENKLFEAYMGDWATEVQNKNLSIYGNEILPNEKIMRGHRFFKKFMKNHLGKQTEGFADVSEECKASPMYKLLHALETIKTQGVEKINSGSSGLLNEMFPNNQSGIPNGIAVITKDKQTGEDILDCVEFYSKLSAVEQDIDTGNYHPYERVFKSDFITCGSGEESETLVKDMTQAFENAGRNYEATGRKTILHIRNMEDLINPEKASGSEIALMKDYMASTAEDYKTIYTLVITDPKKLSYEAIQGHRIGLKINLQDVTRKEADEVLRLRFETKEAVDELTRIYSSHAEEYHDLRLRELELHQKLSARRELLQKLYENPQENKAKILAILDETPDNPVDLSEFDVVKETFHKAKETVPEAKEGARQAKETLHEIKEDRPVIESVIKKPQVPLNTPAETKSLYNKIGNFIKNNKTPLALALALVALISAGVAFYFASKKNTQKASESVSGTLLKNLSMDKFIKQK